ncbi:C40 family peptidase [Pseudonocardia zijingensis]|uniref:NlpC/P60 domain-containing protein n=1 Tax=Pseudonocardia zijingensis TaxID=153376 RepID=A0ABN1PPN4_9PSEU
MTKHLPALAVRAAVVTTTAAIASVVAVLPAAAEPAPVAPAVAPVAVSAPAAAAPTAAAARSTALQHAMSKIGAPYRYGATGPNAFDCSGLVSWAFKKAGKSLPRTSRAMSQVGTPVSRSELQPGDLVFFYKPVSHVGIYIGDGKIVHASTRKSPVKISDMGRMKFNSARRV